MGEKEEYESRPIIFNFLRNSKANNISHYHLVTVVALLFNAVFVIFALDFSA